MVFFLFTFVLRSYFYIVDVHVECVFPFVFVFPLPCPTPGDLLAGLSKFAKLARSVTRSKTLVSQFSSHPVSIKDSTRHVQSHLAHVSITKLNYLFDFYHYLLVYIEFRDWKPKRKENQIPLII